MTEMLEASNNENGILTLYIDEFIFEHVFYGSITMLILNVV